MASAILSVSLPVQIAKDIRDKGWSPSALLVFGYETKLNGKDEGKIATEISAMQKKIEFLSGRLSETSKRLWDLEEEKQCSSQKK